MHPRDRSGGPSLPRSSITRGSPKKADYRHPGQDRQREDVLTERSSPVTETRIITCGDVATAPAGSGGGGYLQKPTLNRAWKVALRSIRQHWVVKGIRARFLQGRLREGRQFTA